jgi:hypothetical protein
MPGSLGLHQQAYPVWRAWCKELEASWASIEGTLGVAGEDGSEQAVAGSEYVAGQRL